MDVEICLFFLYIGNIRTAKEYTGYAERRDGLHEGYDFKEV